MYMYIHVQHVCDQCRSGLVGVVTLHTDSKRVPSITNFYGMHVAVHSNPYMSEADSQKTALPQMGFEHMPMLHQHMYSS